MVEGVASEATEIQVRAAVVVVISDGDSLPETGLPEAGIGGNIAKLIAAQILEETDFPRGNQHDIEEAVAIDIDQPDAVSHILLNIERGGGLFDDEVQAGASRHILKKQVRRSRRERCRRRGGQGDVNRGAPRKGEQSESDTAGNPTEKACALPVT